MKAKETILFSNMNCCDKECKYREFNGGDEISDFYYCGFVGIEVDRGENMCLLDKYDLELD